MPSRIRLAICGYGRSGKNSAANWFVENTCLQYKQSTSEAAAEICFAALRGKYGYQTVEEAFADRHNHRKAWADLIWKFNEPDGLTLYRQMLPENDILNGIRKADELFACQMSGFVDLSIWIDRPGCEETGSMTLKMADCDIVVPNHETAATFPARYFAKLSRLAKSLGV